MVVDVPPVVRNKARAAGAADWLDGLPERVATLEAEWSFQTVRVLEGGTESLVAEVELADGGGAVLKLPIPRHPGAIDDEITVLRLAAGRGCALLLRHDTGRGAMLLELLGPPMYRLGLPLQRRHELLCATAAQVWRPAPDCGLTTGAEKARALAGFITSTWHELDAPCSERAISYALECAGRRMVAHDDERAVLVHGDVHQWNALSAGDGFKLVDPDGLLAEPEYDLGVIIREDPVELLQGDPRERARFLAALSGLDPDAIWEWGVTERVSTGLLCTQVDMQPAGRELLEAAEAVVPERW